MARPGNQPGIDSRAVLRPRLARARLRGWCLEVLTEATGRTWLRLSVLDDLKEVF